MKSFTNLPEQPKERMTEMRLFFAFVIKEFWHVFRDPKTLLLLFGMPIAQILLFGFALTNEIKNSEIVVCDYANDEASRKIIERLHASRNFDIKTANLTHDEIEAEFKKGSIKMAIVFPANFYADLAHLQAAQVQIITDASDPNTANTLANYAENIIMASQRELFKVGQLPLQIRTEVRMLYNPELKGVYNFVPGVMALVLLLVCVLMTSVSIVREKEMGTMEVLLVSPFNPIMVVLSKAVPYFLLSMLNLTAILVLSTTVMDMPINGNIGLLYLASSLLILTALALGLLISNVTESQQTAMLLSLMGMLLPAIMFTGFMFPIENMPLPLQLVSNIVPSKWYYIVVKSVMIKGIGIAGVWKELLILAGMATVLLAITVRNFKIRLA